MNFVFFIYGLSFYSLALTIFLRYDGRSVLRLAHILWLLAGFALLHGFKEWLDLWRMYSEIPIFFVIANPLLLLASYLLLYEFGRRLLLESLTGALFLPSVRFIVGPVGYATMIVTMAVVMYNSGHRSLDLSIWSRYLPGFLGALMASAGTHLYFKNRLTTNDREEPVHRHALSWRLATGAFALYGISAGLIVEPGPGFLASVLNTTTVSGALGFPVQIIRAVCALGLALSIGHVLQIFHVEHELRLKREIRTRQSALNLYEETKNFLHALLKTSDQCIVQLDSRGVVVAASALALQKLMFQGNTLIGHAFHTQCHHSRCDGTRRAEDIWSNSPIHNSGEPRIQTQDCFWRANGTWFRVSYVATPIRAKEVICGTLIVFNDLSE